MKNIVNLQKKLYQENFLVHGDTPRGTFQNNKITIQERHKHLIENLLPFLPLKFSLCDLGSGTCDLHAYLLKKGIQHNYTGLEIVPEMRKKAQKKFPYIRILGSNILSKSFVEKFDVLVASGTFNLRKGTNPKVWEKYTLAIINKMFSLAKVGIAYNALTKYSEFYNDNLHYMSPEKSIFHCQKKLSRFYCLSTIWPLYEFTMTIIKPKIVRVKYSRNEFVKYLK